MGSESNLVLIELNRNDCNFKLEGENRWRKVRSNDLVKSNLYSQKICFD